jgi:exodeoxyribonuclease V alpha subunit
MAFWCEIFLVPAASQKSSDPMHPLTLTDNTPTTGQAPVLSRKACEVVGSFIRERMRFEASTPGDPATILAEFSLLLSGPDADPTVTTCKGPAFEDELVAGLDYRLFGRWKSYTNPRTKITEEQFVFDSFVVAEPASRDAVISYLSAAGDGLGLGRARASRLWQEFGADAVRVMREEPERAADRLYACSLKLSHENAHKIAENLRSKQAIEGCSLDLQTLLAKRGFPRLIDRYCIAKWGNKAAERIRRNPFVLLQFKGCGFKRCDSLYRDLKLPLDWIVRQGVAAWDAIARDSTGNIWFPLAVAESGVIKAVGREKAKPERALHCAKLLGGLRELQTSKPKGPLIPGGNVRWVAERRNADHEQQIAEAVVASRRELLAWPDVSRVSDISEHQRENLRRAIAGPIGILGGGPGTGKTFTVAALAKLLVSTGFGDGQILIGAPTGKAAVRVTENLANYGLSLRAKTWHSHLAAVQSESKRDNGLGIKPTFRAKILISDESSMIDADLFAAIMRHRAAGSHLLLVGDVHQLPPVGPGAPLRDLIFAGLPYGELTEIKRNSGGIVEACAAIRQGRKFSLGDNLTLADCFDPVQQIAGMLHAIHYAASSKGLDPIWDVQPLAAVNEDSPLARKKLNEILQNELNPSPGVEGSPFRLRDKAVCLKNSKYKNASGKEVAEEGFQDESSGEIYVANGELAEVVDVDRTSFVARLKSPDREVRVFRGKQGQAKESGDGEAGESGTGEGSAAKWDLGYCLSVHKSQGSEWPLVLPILDTYGGAKRVTSREWIYTAISRAMSHCRLIGDIQTAYSMCERVSLRDRKTFLAERIGYLTAEETLAGW